MTDSGERLSRDYPRQKQAPKMPRNIMRRPLRVPGDGLPMEPVKEQSEPAGPDGYGALLDAVRSVEPISQDDVPVAESISPYCMACGRDCDYGTEACPDCGGDVYDPTAP